MRLKRYLLLLAIIIAGNAGVYVLFVISQANKYRMLLQPVKKYANGCLTDKKAIGNTHRNTFKIVNFNKEATMSTKSTTKTILLADDDMDDAEIFGHILEDIDPTLKFYHVTNGAGVMQHFEGSEKPTPDIIFLDLNMPEMNGWQCLSQLKAEGKTRDIPVLIYSTSSHHRDKQQAIASGASAFITKPSDYKTLQNLLFKISTGLHRDLMSAIHKL